MSDSAAVKAVSMTEAPHVTRAASATVVKNLAWLLVGPVLRLAISIPLAGFTAHHLGLAGYGDYNLALSLVVMLCVLANLGLNDVLTRAVAQHPERAPSLWASVLAFKAGPLSAYLVLLMIVAWSLGYSTDILWMVLLLGATQWLISLENTSRSVFAGYQQMGVLGGADIAKVTLDSILWFTVLYLGYGAVALSGVRLTIAVFGFGLTAVMLSRRLQLRFSRPQWPIATAMLPAGFRFALTAALASVYERVGFVVLAHLTGSSAVALVSTATTLTEKIVWFAPAVQGALFPFFSRLQVAERDRFGAAFARALRYQMFIATGCGLGASLLGPWVIRLVFPREFWTAGAVVEVLGWASAVKLVSSFFLTVLQSLNRERQVSWLSAIQCLLYILATCVGVGSWGVMGFAWAAVAAESVGVGLYARVLWRAGVFTELESGSLLAIASCGLALFFATAWLPGGRENLLGVVGMLACFPVLVIVSRGVSRDDMRYLQGLWLSKRPSVA